MIENAKAVFSERVLIPRERLDYEATSYPRKARLRSARSRLLELLRARGKGHTVRMKNKEDNYTARRTNT